MALVRIRGINDMGTSQYSAPLLAVDRIERTHKNSICSIPQDFFCKFYLVTFLTVQNNNHYAKIYPLIRWLAYHY